MKAGHGSPVVWPPPMASQGHDGPQQGTFIVQGSLYPLIKQKPKGEDLLISSPLHLCFKHAQDVLLLALCDVRHAAELTVIVVILVLGMLPLNKLCKGKSPDPKRLLVWIGHSLKGLLALYFS